jgi:transcriptional regulator with XRE-family HTH domain
MYVENLSCEGQNQMTRDPVTELLTQNIKRLMQKRKLNPAELASRSGLNRTAIYDIMSGKSQSPRVKTCAQIAVALAVPISDLFLTDGQLQSQMEIVRIFLELGIDDQKRVEKIATAFLPDTST